MSNDDLGQFPMPTQPQTPAEPSTPPQSSTATQSANDALTYHDPFAKPTDNTARAEETIVKQPLTEAPSFDETPEPTTDQTQERLKEESPDSSLSAFEETPEEIPSVHPSYMEPAQNTQSEATEDTGYVEPATPEQTPEPALELEVPSAPISVEQPTQEPPQISEPTTPVQQPPEAVLATSIPKSSQSFAPFIFIGLVLVAGIGLAMSVFLFSQSAQLKRQLVDITQTLEKQKTTVTPTPTPTPIEVATPSLTPIPTPDATMSATPSLTPTPTPILSATPLLYSKEALRVAINRQPNAQLILIKSENASDLTKSITKYFFRQDLKTKKYFYVTINDKGEAAVIDKAIYVTPDNNIPSLNEAVTSTSYGIDLDQAIKIAYDSCTSGLCETANLKAQFIKSSDNFIWQLSFAPEDTSKEPLIIQLNSQTKEILYKSPGF